MRKRKEDHTELMRTDPEAYGFTPDQLSALTREEMRSGVTRDYMAAYGGRASLVGGRPNSRLFLEIKM